MPKKGENIYKRKDGRWEGRYIKERTFSGKAIYGYVYASTYRDVKSKLTAARISHQKSKSCKSNVSPILISQIANDWLQAEKSQVKESTYNKYKNIVHGYIIPSFENLELHQLTKDMLEQFFQKLLTEGGTHKQGLSPKTVSDVLSIMRRILNYASEQGYESINATKKITIKRKEKELRVLSCQEQNQLCRYMINHLNEKNMGVLLCLFTGLRIGELCALKWEDISISDQTIHVHQSMQRIQTEKTEGSKTKIIISTPKSSCSIRTIPLPNEIAVLLSDKQKSGYFLTGRKDKFIEPRTMQNHFKRIVSASGVAPANFHALRHSFATRCVELGFDIKSLSEILGHASVNITMNRYVHPSMELKRQNMQRLSQLIAVK